MPEAQQCAVAWKDYGVLVLALLGVCITWGQWITARSKLILDLYEKRRVVYSKFHGPIGEAVREGRSDLKNFFEYINVLDEARFLFGRDVLDYMKQIKGTLAKLGEASSMLRDGGRLPEEDRSRYARVSYDCMIELADFWPRLDKLMIPYMLMEQKRPWWVGRATG